MGTKKWWEILAIIWFAIYGILAITSITFAFQGVVLGILALAVAVVWAFGK